MSSFRHRLVSPLLSDNPVTTQILGLCSALAVSSSLRPALIMAISVVFVLVYANVVISLIRHWIPTSVRLIVEMTLIASAVIVIDETLKAFAPQTSRVLSVFVGLIVTNCIVLGRAEAFALHKPVMQSFADALGNGLGYAIILLVIAAIRELAGAGSLFDYPILPADFPVNAMMAYSPSAFFLLGLIVWLIRSRIPALAARSPRAGESVTCLDQG